MAAQTVAPNTPPSLHLLLAAPSDAAYLPSDVGADRTYYFPFGSPVASQGANFVVCPPSLGSTSPTGCAAYATDKVRCKDTMQHRARTLPVSVCCLLRPCDSGDMRTPSSFLVGGVSVPYFLFYTGNYVM